MKFEEIDFYDYRIRMCLDNGIRMYLVSDLLRQYNEKHGTNKRFKLYLENKQTQELIEHMAKTVGRNSCLPSNGGQNVKSDIPDVIQYIKTHHSAVLTRATSSARNCSMLASCGQILTLLGISYHSLQDFDRRTMTTFEKQTKSWSRKTRN